MKSEKEAITPRLYRLIDANLNRLREGIRVVEDICRYIYDHKELASQLKSIRHAAKLDDTLFIDYRDIASDVLKESSETEMERKDLHSLIKANMKRAQESARVLEESFKLVDTKIAERFKKIRYSLYETELNLQKNLRSR